MRVALAALCRKFFSELGITVASHVVTIAGVNAVPVSNELGASDINKRVDESPLRCLDKEAEAKMTSVIDEAKSRGDTVGGAFEVIVDGMPVGIGSYVHWDRRIDGILAGAMMSIHAIWWIGGRRVTRLRCDVHDRIEQRWCRAANK
jgi:chorismate synthase